MSTEGAPVVWETRSVQTHRLSGWYDPAPSETRRRQVHFWFGEIFFTVLVAVTNHSWKVVVVGETAKRATSPTLRVTGGLTWTPGRRSGVESEPKGLFVDQPRGLPKRLPRESQTPVETDRPSQPHVHLSPHGAS